MSCGYDNHGAIENLHFYGRKITNGKYPFIFISVLLVKIEFILFFPSSNYDFSIYIRNNIMFLYSTLQKCVIDLANTKVIKTTKIHLIQKNSCSFFMRERWQLKKLYEDCNDRCHNLQRTSKLASQINVLLISIYILLPISLWL